MKLKLLSAFVILFTAIGFVSCDTEPVDPVLVGQDPTQNTPAAFEVDFSGQTYQATTVQASVINNSITITALRADGSTFMINVPGTTVGTYTNAIIMYTPAIGSAQDFYTNDSDEGLNGEVKITSINTTTHKITGTFHFTGIFTGVGQPNIEFTSGIFTNITYSGTIVPVNDDAFFKVTYDGTTFTAEEYYVTVGHSIITVQGIRGANHEYVSVSVFGNTVGTYSGSQVISAEYFSGDGESDDYFGYTNDYTDAEQPAVTVNITEIDEVNHIISGTFSFTGVGSGVGTGAAVNGQEKQFTAGEFSVPYITNDPTGAQLSATVDGTSYNYSCDMMGILSTGITGFGAQVIGPGNLIEIWSDVADGNVTHPFSSAMGSDHYALYTDTATGTQYQINEGSITITDTYYDDADGVNYVEGTFNFVVKNSAGEVIHTVTNGTYKLEYEGE